MSDKDEPLSFSIEELLLAAEAERYPEEAETEPEQDHGLFAEPGWLPLKLRKDV